MLEKLAHSLHKRGFLITKMEDHIYFGKGNHEDELEILAEMFQELNIAVRIDDRKIYLLEDQLDETVLEQITWYKACNHEARGGSGWRSWRYFITRNHGPKVNTFVLETGVSLLVKALSAAGIVTNCSCHGHGHSAPSITFCGKQNTIWFSILFDEIKDLLNLNYEWDFDKVSEVDSSFSAKRKGNFEEWNLERILEDTLQMAEYFLKESERLSNMKKEIFGGKYKSTRRMVHEMDYYQLYEWMKEKYNDYLVNSSER